MTNQLPLYQRCTFNTERLLIKSVKSQILDEDKKRQFASKIQTLLTPAVTRSLPSDWRNLTSFESVCGWLAQRIEESTLLAIQLKSNSEIIGLIFLHDSGVNQVQLDLHIGYLLGEPYWSKGYGSELIKGLVDWAYFDNHIHSLVGGVEIDNTASIKVLEKNGFSRSNLNSPDKNVIFLEHVIN